MRVASALLVFAAATTVACIDDVYVGGSPCGTSVDCPPIPEDPADPVGTLPEQCVSTGATFVCAPLPFTRPPTTCTDGSQCLAAGYPVETQCVEGACQCPTPVGTPPPGCVWNPASCACGGTPPPEG